MRKFIAFGPALVVLLATLVTLVAAPAAVRLIGYASTDAQIQLARQELDQENILKQIDKAVRNIADVVEPSVVHIGVQAASGNRIRSAQGSGWVFDKQGHIVTNAHVVRGAGRIFVQFNDGRAADAELVGQDTVTDIAVLRVNTTEGIFPIDRATGVVLHQGDRVYAFGSPFGFKFSMSEGIVSGLGRDPSAILGQDQRSNGTSQSYTNFIQTDAAVNPGNSGGPLVNVDGKLVGMNVAIATAPGVNNGEGGQSAGISFAIPLSTIDRVVDQIVSGNAVARGYLGIGRPSDDDQNQAWLNRLGYHGRGVVVTNVEPGSPAEKGGMQVSDVIVKLDDQPITGVPGLRSSIANNAPGDKVSVEVWRGGETKKLTVELGRLVTESEKNDAVIALARFGIADVGETKDGRVLVTEVRTPSLAFQAGFRPNLRIVSVNGTAVKSIEELKNAIANEGLQQGRDLRVATDGEDGPKELKISGK